MTCPECRLPLFRCPSCGDLVCGCRGAAIYLRQHYEPDGTPRRYRRWGGLAQHGLGESFAWERQAVMA